MRLILSIFVALWAASAQATMFTLGAFLHTNHGPPIDYVGNSVPAIPSESLPFTGWIEIDGPLRPDAKLLDWSFPQNIHPYPDGAYTTDLAEIGVNAHETSIHFLVPWQELRLTIPLGDEDKLPWSWGDDVSALETLTCCGARIVTHGRWDLTGQIDGVLWVTESPTRVVPEPGTWVFLLGALAPVALLSRCVR